MSTAFCGLAAAALALLLPLLFIIAFCDLCTASTPRRVRIYSRSGYSQRAIAARLGISRYRVSEALAGA